MLRRGGLGLITSQQLFYAAGAPARFDGQLRHARRKQPVVVPASGMKGLGAQPLVGLRSIRRMGRVR